MQGVFNFYLSYFFVFLKKKFFYGLDDNFMGHDHSHTGHQHEHGESTRNLGIAFFLNLGFAIIEIIGGLWTNSVAMRYMISGMLFLLGFLIFWNVIRTGRGP